jgi:hypothetical protein
MGVKVDAEAEAEWGLESKTKAHEGWVGGWAAHHR